MASRLLARYLKTAVKQHRVWACAQRAVRGMIYPAREGRGVCYRPKLVCRRARIREIKYKPKRWQRHFSYSSKR